MRESFSLVKVFLFAVVCAIIVVDADRSNGDDPIMLNPPAELPRYQLSNARVENDSFGRSVMAFDWRRTKEGKGGGSIAMRGTNGRIRTVFGGSLDGQSGTKRFQQMFSRSRSSIDVEFFVESPGPAGRNFMLSNAVRIGNPGPPTRARAMNAEDQAALAEHKRISNPPPTLPDGYVAVQPGTRLIPGMLLKAGWRGEWEDAEVLADDGVRMATVLYPHQSGAIQLRSKNGWLAITPEMKRDAIGSPGKFQPSMRVLPGTVVQIPDDAVPLTELSNVPVGLPISYAKGSQLEQGFIVRVDGLKMSVRSAGGSSKSDRSMSRGSIVVDQAVAASVNDPLAVQAMAKNIELNQSAQSDLPLKDYKARRDVPSGYSTISATTPVQSGSTVKAYWGSKWYDLTVLADSNAGPVAVRWPSFGAVWDCRIRRDQLAIENTRNRSGSVVGSGAGISSGNGVRTWKDATGKFSVDAAFKEVRRNNLVLSLPDGREMEIPIAKLSESDRVIAEQLYKESAQNPFKVLN